MRRESVAVLANDVEINEHPDRERWEHRQWRRIFAEQPHGIHQGIYVATASGRFLGRVNHGWPAPDPRESLRALRRAFVAYRALPPDARLPARDPDRDADRLRYARDRIRIPAGALDLRVTKRSYPFAGMELFDRRHPEYLSLDRLLFRESEYRALVPAERRLGARSAWPEPIVERLVVNNAFTGNEVPWDMAAARRAEIFSEVTGVRNDALQLRFSGTLELRAETRWNRDTYRGELLGSGEYDLRSGRFTAFELVALGDHRVGEMKENMHRGSPDSRVAARLAPFPAETGPDLRPMPYNWRYGYPRGWWE